MCSRLYMYIIQIYTQHSIMSHKNNGRLKNKTKEKACLFNRPSQHDSALISRPYITSIATATRRPPTPIHIVNVHSKCYIFLRSEAKSLFFTVFKKINRKDLKIVALFAVTGVRKDPRLRTCSGTGCLHRNTHLVTGSIFSCVYITCHR